MRPQDEDVLRAEIATFKAQGVRPRPLTHAECDVSGFPGPLFDVNRLQNSQFWTAAVPELRGIAVSLWLLAWRQSPPGSLPDDDAFLARHCRVRLDRFQRLRTAPISPMHGFVLCDDGRWYHPVLCADVLRCWRKAKVRSEAAKERWEAEKNARKVAQAARGLQQIGGALRR